MIKIVEKVLDKVMHEGKREYHVNGRMHNYPNVGELEERYGAYIKNNVLTFRHWGTDTIIINLDNNDIIDYYGEGVSDRDSLNSVLDYLNIKGKKFHYYPSKDLFKLE